MQRQNVCACPMVGPFNTADLRQMFHLKNRQERMAAYSSVRRAEVHENFLRDFKKCVVEKIWKDVRMKNAPRISLLSLDHNTPSSDSVRCPVVLSSMQFAILLLPRRLVKE